MHLMQCILYKRDNGRAAHAVIVAREGMLPVHIQLRSSLSSLGTVMPSAVEASQPVCELRPLDSLRPLGVTILEGSATQLAEYVLLPPARTRAADAMILGRGQGERR